MARQLKEINKLKIQLEALTLNQVEEEIAELQEVFDFSFDNTERVQATLSEFLIMQKEAYYEHAYLTFKLATKYQGQDIEYYLHIYYNCGKFIKRIAYSEIYPGE